jgi:acyl carrier protein
MLQINPSIESDSLDIIEIELVRAAEEAFNTEMPNSDVTKIRRTRRATREA